MKMKILVVLVVYSVLSANATFSSKQNDNEQKPDFIGSLLALKKNLLGGLSGGKNGGTSESHASGSASGGIANGYSYQPPPQQVQNRGYSYQAPAPVVYSPPKPVYGPPQVQSQPQPIYRAPQIQSPPKPVYGPPQVQSQPQPIYRAPQIQSPPKPVYGPPQVQPAAPIGISESGSSGLASSLGGLGGGSSIFQSIGLV
jgi:hypothetical protein